MNLKFLLGLEFLNANSSKEMKSFKERKREIFGEPHLGLSLIMGPNKIRAK